MNSLYLDTPRKIAISIEKSAKSLVDHRGRMFVITLLSDVSAFILAILSTHWLLYQIRGIVGPSQIGEIDHVLFVMICLALFMRTNLYPGMGLNPAMEMKTVTQLTILSFLIVFGIVMMRIPLWTQEKVGLIMIGGFSIILILAIRWLTRILAVQMGVWGEPVVLIANKEEIENIAAYFYQRHRLGFLPVLGVAERVRGQQTASMMQRMGVKEFLNLSNGYFLNKGIQTVLVSTQIGSELIKSKLNHDLMKKFKRLIFLSEMDWLEGVSITYHDLEGMMGMEARQRLLTPIIELLKRGMDVLFSLLLGAFSLPVLLLSSLAIRLDTPGPVFFKQNRVGRHGQTITIYKFRTMLENSDQILEEYLSKNPNVKKEWDATQKLKDDPRITRAGRFLRNFSVDEIPQLLNVIKGDMSLVGPRPILFGQKALYGEGYAVYTSVRPGLTGFWQVSGRNHNSFKQRVAYDLFYVRNWSVWLDIYILLRTVWVVLSRDGAY